MKTGSLSSRRSYLRSAEAEEKKVVAAEKKLADLRKRSAQNAAAQTAKTRSLRLAEKSEQKAQERADHRRRQVEISHAKDIARLSSNIKLVMVREPQPEKLRVLYLTANPEAIEQEFQNPDGSIVKESAWLRTEAEVRGVKQALRGSRYRELVDFDHRSAATYEDLVEGINDLRPHIVHFSGHGGSKGLLFDNGSVDAPEGRALSFSILAETLAATDEPPTLLVLNACDTLEGGDAILPAVPVIIAMSDSIADAAAALFATRFYAAVAAAQSVGSSLRQAIAAMRAASLEDADLPQISVRDGIDVDQLILVKVARATADYFEEQPGGSIRVSGPVTDLIGGLNELITTLIELGPEGEEVIAKYSRRRQSRSAAHSLDGLSFAPHGFRRYLERIARGEATLEDLHGIRRQLDSSAESVEFHLDQLSTYREKLREARGMVATEKLDTIMYGEFGKDRLRRMLSELATIHNTDPRSDATVGRAKEILAAVKHLNAQIAELHDLILESAPQAD